MPLPHMNPSDDELRRIYAQTKTIAAIGASTDPWKAGHYIPEYLQSQGYRIRPVNPRGGELFGEPVARSLDELKGQVDVVDVFRPPEESVDVAKAAIESGAKVLWFQTDTGTEEAARVAKEAGMTVVMDICMGVTHGRLGLGPGPH